MTCPHFIAHGPGHQSQTQCDGDDDGHEHHSAVLYPRVFEWESRHVEVIEKDEWWEPIGGYAYVSFTDVFDNDPE